MFNITIIQYGGLSYRTMIRLACRLDKRMFKVNFLWCIPGRDLRSSFTHPIPTSEEKERVLKLLAEAGVTQREFRVGARLVEDLHLPWINTDFWDVFRGVDTDVVFTWRSGGREYPFCHMNAPLVEWNVFGWADTSINLRRSLAVSACCRSDYISRGGNPNISSIVHLPTDPPMTSENMRRELGIPEDCLVVGMHQRSEDTIFSPIPLNAVKYISEKVPNVIVLFLGGSKKYENQADSLEINGIFLHSDSNYLTVSKFLNTLDIYVHGRRDGETLGAAIQEAMIHNLPIISHKSQWNAHVETIGDGGIVCEGQRDYNLELLKMAEDPVLRSSRGEKSFRRALELYSWGISLNLIEKSLVDSIIEFRETGKYWIPLPLNIYSNRRALYFRLRRIFTNIILAILIWIFGQKGARLPFLAKTLLLKLYRAILPHTS